MDRRVPGDEDRLASDRDVSRRLPLAAALTLLPFIALAVWARFNSPAAWEPGLVDAVALKDGAFGDVFRLMNTLGNLPFWSVLVAIVTAGIWLVRGARAALLVGLSLASDLAAFVVKIVVERQRPDTAATEHFFGPDSFSFPSGHVVRAVALVAVLAWILAPPGLRFRLALAAGVIAGIVMGYARVALGVHWPTDALG
ncbi:MAG: phosphatase PAP2 family protein, partial [Candidatus Limnocylindrales bacterium]